MISVLEWPDAETVLAHYPWAETGRTSVDQGTHLCGYHHREFENLGWTCHMRDGTPWWTPPKWVDREQTPIRNTAHDLVLT
jgi:hypothetical protein